MDVATARMADDMTLILSDWMNGRGILDRRCVAATDLDQTEWVKGEKI